MKNHLPRNSALKRKLIALAVASCFAAELAYANPTNPAVVSGSAIFRQSGNLLQVTNSPNAIINWGSFSIGASEVTRFIQQSQASAVLNRVVGQDPSAILGALQSNGRVFLINPNGILFGQNSIVDVAGLVASTLNLSNADFLAGRLRFTEVPGAGSIVNQGNITTGSGGNVYLVAPDVTNSGIITSPKGEVVLAAGKSVELVNPGTPNLRVEITAPDNEARNLGQIVADSGRVGIYAGLISHSGTIRADSAVAGENGQILLKATKNATLESGSVTSASGPSGGKIEIQSGDTTLVSGTVEAKGTSMPSLSTGESTSIPSPLTGQSTTVPSPLMGEGEGGGDVGKGGTIHILGNKVGLVDAARVDASGQTGGGTVLIGGDYRGENPDVQNAFVTFLGPNASVSADAMIAGNGGKVIVWADDTTRAYGSISARGGAQGGNGGFVETSGKYLEVTRAPDITAPAGNAGTWLLDPETINIEAASSNNITGTSPFQPVGAGTATLSVTTLNNALNAGGTVIVDTTGGGSGTGDINVNAPVRKTAGPVATLDLRANANININADIISSAGPLNMQLAAGEGGAGGIGLGSVTLATAGGILNANVPITSASGSTITLGGITIVPRLDARTLNVSAATLVGGGSAGTLNVPEFVEVDLGGGTFVLFGGPVRFVAPFGADTFNWTGGTFFGATSVSGELHVNLLRTNGLGVRVFDAGALNAGGVQVTGGTLDIFGSYTAASTTVSGGTINFYGDASTATLTLLSGAVGGGGDLTVSTDFNQTGGTFGSTFNNLEITKASGNLFSSNFGATNSLSLAATTGQVNVDAPINMPGNVTMAGGTGVNVSSPIASGGNITLRGDDINIGNSINAGTGSVSLAPFSTSRNINIETSPTAGVLSLSPSQLQNITAGTLEIGRSTDAGTLTVGSALTPSDINAWALRLQHQNINIEAPLNITGDLAMFGRTGINVSSPISAGFVTLLGDYINIDIGNSINAGSVSLAPFSTSRNINIETNPTAGVLSLSPLQLQNITAGTLEIGRSTDSGTLTVATALTSTDINASTLKLADQNIAINQPITLPASEVHLVSGRGTGITQVSTAPITADKLLADGGGSVGMHSASNMVNVLAGQAWDDFRFKNGQTLQIGWIGGVPGVTSRAGNVTLDSGAGDLNIVGTSVTGADVSLTGNNIKVGSAAAAAATSVWGTGAMTVNATGGLTVQAGTTPRAHTNLETQAGQTISAKYVEVIGQGDSRATISSSVGNQTITTSGKNASDEGIVVKNLGSSVAQIFSGGSQNITVNDADFVRVIGATGEARIYSASGNQTIVLQGAGLNHLELGDAAATGASQLLGATQSVTAGTAGQAGGITLIGGITENADALISATSTSQTVSTSGTISATGGTAPGPTGADAGIRNDGSGLQTITAQGVVLQGGATGTSNNAFFNTFNGGQAVTVGSGGITMTGGPAGANITHISQFSTSAAQTITVNDGASVTLQGGGGTGSLVSIRNDGTAQLIDFTNGGALEVSGGTGTSSNSAHVWSAGTQSITSSGSVWPTVTLTGGTGGLADQGNYAVLQANVSQTITAADTTVKGGASGISNLAVIQSPFQAITVHGNLTLTGQGSAGTTSNTGNARIGGLPQVTGSPSATNLVLNVDGDLTMTGGTTSSALARIAGGTGFANNVTINVGGNVTLNAGSAAEARIGSSATNISGGNISIEAGGAIALNSNNTVGSVIRTTDDVQLISGSGVSQGQNSLIVADKLLVDGGSGNVDLQAPNMVGTLASKIVVPTTTSTSRSFNFKNAQTLNIDTVGSVDGINVAIGQQAFGIYNIDIGITTTSGDLNVNKPVSGSLTGLVLCAAGQCPALTAPISLTAAQDVNVNRGVRGSAITLTAGRDITVSGLNAFPFEGITAEGEQGLILPIVSSNASVVLDAGRNLTVTNSSISASSLAGGDGGSATLTLGAGAGAIDINSGSSLSAGLSSFGFLVPGDASSIALDAGNGITVNNSTIQAGFPGFFAGEAGKATIDFKGNSGAVNLTDTTISALAGPERTFEAKVVVTGNGISLNNSAIKAQAGSGSGGAGGAATITLGAGSASIQIKNGSNLAAAGGFGDGGDGGSATVELTAGSISVNDSTIVSTGGSASLAPGGTGKVTFNADTGLAVSNSSISATGGSGFGSGAGGGAASVSLNAGTSITLTGATTSVTARGGPPGAGDATVTITSTAGDIDTAANIQALGFAGASVELTANSGYIHSTGGLLDAEGLSFNSITLSAAKGIGEVGNPIRIEDSVGQVVATNTTTGDIVLAQVAPQDITFNAFNITNSAAGGLIDITAEAGSITVNTTVSHPNGPLILTAGGAGNSITVNPSGSINAGVGLGGASLVADNMELLGTVTGGFATNILPFTTTRNIDLGSACTVSCPALSLTNAELNNITPGIWIGSASGGSGSLTISAPISTPSFVSLNGTSVTQNSGATIAVGGLRAAASGNIILTEAGNQIPSLTTGVDGVGGQLQLVTASGIVLGSGVHTTNNGDVNIQAGGDITFDSFGGFINAGSGTVTLISTGGAITTAASPGTTNIVGSAATLAANTGIGTLANPIGTQVSSLSLSSGSGEIGISNTGNLALTLSSFGGTDASISATGAMTFGAPASISGNLSLVGNGMTVGQNLSTTGNLVLSAAGSDLNISGATVIGQNISLYGNNINVGSAAATVPTSVSSSGLMTVSANNVSVRGADAGTGVSGELVSSAAQDISASNIALTGGTGGTNNLAQINAGTTQTVTIAGGGAITLQGGGGSNNLAAIRSSSGSQLIDFISGGSLRLTGGTGAGGLNSAGIRATFGSQTITGSPVISITGGASGGTALIGNHADLMAGGAQSIAASSITLTGGAGGTNNQALIDAGGGRRVSLHLALH